MKNVAHMRINMAAFDALPPRMCDVLDVEPNLVADSSCYPDTFEDPVRGAEEKDRIDPEWRRYCHFPEHLAAEGQHSWPTPPTDTPGIKPMFEYLFGGAVQAIGEGDPVSAFKYLGCLSHYFGDSTQSAHLMDIGVMKRLLPPPDKFQDFCYHRGVELVIGEVGALEPPSLLGLTLDEACWWMANRNAQNFEDCQRYCVPIIQAIFGGREDEAIQIAGAAMTPAAQMSLDAMATAVSLAKPEFQADSLAPPNGIDLREIRPYAIRWDELYGGALRDSSRLLHNYERTCAPEFQPAKLRKADGTIRAVDGIGVLPDRGLGGPPDCHLRYDLPKRVFERFECLVGLHPDLSIGGAVEFVVELDGEVCERTGPVVGEDPEQSLAIALGDARDLTLRVVALDGGDSYFFNHAVWAHPWLVRN